MTGLWSHAHTTSTDKCVCPTNYGWEIDYGLLQPSWFDGPEVTDSLFHSDGDANIENDSDINQTDSNSQLIGGNSDGN